MRNQLLSGRVYHCALITMRRALVCATAMTTLLGVLSYRYTIQLFVSLPGALAGGYDLSFIKGEATARHFRDGADSDASRPWSLDWRVVSCTLGSAHRHGILVDQITVHCAVLAFVFASWPICSRVFRRKPHLLGTCSTCGYDLRGTQTGRCPECGSPFVSDLRLTSTEAANQRRPDSDEG